MTLLDLSPPVFVHFLLSVTKHLAKGSYREGFILIFERRESIIMGKMCSRQLQGGTTPWWDKPWWQECK